MTATPGSPAAPENNPAKAITFILVGMVFITINDSVIKFLSGDYPLHQMVFFRSGIGLMFTLVLVQIEGGFQILRTARPVLHLIRALLVVVANMSFFAALAVLPLADTNALFFVSPLLITLLSVPLLGEKVGVRRLLAILVGFLGVLIMIRPGADGFNVTMLLPLLAASAYALMQVLTRKLGVASKASAMAAYIQLTFLCVSTGFFIVAGDGRFAEGVTDPSLEFLLRAWVWPASSDWALFILLGVMSGGVGYTLSMAYRTASAATVAPYEYAAMPMSVAVGWYLFGDWPSPTIFLGIAMIVGSGLYVFLRESQKSRTIAALPKRGRAG
ncbi:DMT family transporter [Shimia biformata]|uniref:DMT family transporter n=1 Tax=Shimia biformata TaxID=1294299 RepID=UPI001950A9CC|nr:DMT family transporter [Shimia biformata]